MEALDALLVQSPQAELPSSSQLSAAQSLGGLAVARARQKASGFGPRFGRSLILEICWLLRELYQVFFLKYSDIIFSDVKHDPAWRLHRCTYVF